MEPTGQPRPSTEGRSPHPRTLLVNVVEAAQILSVSRSSIYQLIWNEELTPVHIGRSVRLPVEQLEHFVASRIAANAK